MRSLILATTAVLVLASPSTAAPRLSHADRLAISRTLDVFVLTAVKRQNVSAAYDRVTPQFRGGLTRAQWETGDIPVYPYDARGTRFHEWVVQYIQGGEVGLQLILRPRNLRHDTIAFNVAVRKIRGRWLVDYFMPAATFATSGPSRVVGPYDFTAVAGESGPSERRLGSIWIVVPSAIVGLGLLVLLGFFVASWFRGRTRAPSGAERDRYAEFAERVRARAVARGYSQRL